MTISSETLIQLRKDRGWPQEKLAAISGISERTIQRIESDGSTCSLETKMALATAFDISPMQLSPAVDSVDSDEMITDWSGAGGLFVMLLTAMMVVLITGLQGMWELYSFILVFGLALIMNVMSYGARATLKLMDKTSWIVKYPRYAVNLNSQIAQVRSLIINIFIIGFVVSLVTQLSLIFKSPMMIIDPIWIVSMATRPIICAIVIMVFWLKPFKNKMEKMLISQRESAEQY